MIGSTSAQTPRAPAGVARAAGGGAGTVHGSVLLVRGSGKSGAPVPVLPLHYQGASMSGEWPLRDFIELGALPGAVPCARLHARQVLWEWGLAALSESAELVLSELVTNAVAASYSLKRISPVRMWLHADSARVLILIWDGNAQPPVRIDTGEDAESGRGLLLVETISSRWGTYATPQLGGKAVWVLIEETEG